jgi:hypothetical protein
LWQNNTRTVSERSGGSNYASLGLSAINSISQSFKASIPLISRKGEPGMLICRECGTTYTFKETATLEKVTCRFGPTSSHTRIISAKAKKQKYYDKQGNEIKGI